ncbi:DEAD/DEAH box helicase [Sediminitomix flava]|uniref:ATP-dependent RNA helicase RhlE n=1 Tax=Sediminitomix flava TaxID=379075 RepID=A0A315ZCM2_SEDFL|nr:DEAD/DEAH box helicase [Sediminitomix flava]PWJ42568.1 ATP-dependent RNA helicase RhlE [Sediminitomix flava]
MRFNRFKLDDRIIRALEDAGMRKPTQIQDKAIPAILKGEDLLGIAQTGTGKTAAFAIPVLQLMTKPAFQKAKGVKAIVMAPTRELSEQSTEVFKSLGKYLKVRTTAVYGGVSNQKQIESLKKTDILVTTPGRLFDLQSQGFVKLDDCKILVVDEADRMLEAGFIKDIQRLIRFLPKKRQTLFFSATIEKQIKKLAYTLVSQNALRIEISPKNPISKNVEHCKMEIEMDDKRFYLEKLIRANEQSKIIVFARTKVRADRVVKAMERVDIHAESLHGDKEQKERLDTLKRFRSGENKILVATDIAARGLDVSGVEFVVNYDLPEKAEHYVHRIGRTGRGNQKGVAVSFVSSGEKEMLKEIEKFINQQIPILIDDSLDYDPIITQTKSKKADWQNLVKEIEVNEEVARKKTKTKQARKKK